MTWLLGRYSAAYASNQYRALQQFFKWLAAEDQLPDPMAGLAPPRVPAKLVPVFAPRSWPSWSGRARAADSPSAVILRAPVRSPPVPAPVPASLRPYLAGPR